MRNNQMRKVLSFFMVLFIGVISYIGFYYILNGQSVITSVNNNRLWYERNKILRGSILDRDGKILTESEKIDGVNVIRYRGGKAFAHVLGYMDPVYGITGLQNLYDRDLMGNQSKGIFGMFRKKENANKGYNLKTTIHEGLQRRAYSLMGESKGAVIIMNPKTGEILTMVSTPSYDPNHLSENWKVILSDNNSPLINRATAGMYPPASTFKIITTVAALENIKDVRDLEIEDTGILKYSGVEILTNYEKNPHGKIKLREGFAYSSNVYFGDIGLKLGNNKLKRVAERFHYNSDTESDGIIINNSFFPSINSLQVAEISQSAIGQNKILATPMQVLITANIIANRGILMRPYLVDEILDGDEVIKKIKPVKDERIISTSNAYLIKDFMKDTVEYGTGGVSKVSGIKVYGKTGTAEHENTPYKPPHSWFVGFAEKDKETEFSFVVLVEQGGVGGVRAASIARDLIKYAEEEGLIN